MVSSGERTSNSLNIYKKENIVEKITIEVKVLFSVYFFKEYSLVVERWSSKPYVWVQFLLLLLMFNLKPLLKSKRLNLKTSKKVLLWHH